MAKAPHVVRPLVMKIEPKSKSDEESLKTALAQIASEDVTFTSSIDPESGEIVISGISVLHLDSIVDVISSKFQIGVIAGAPQVAYRETIKRLADVEYTQTKFNGIQTHVRIKLSVAPRPRDSGNVFESQFNNAPEIAEFAAGVEKGVSSVLNNGVLIGFPIVDAAVTWTDGAYDPAHSPAVVFEVAARYAAKEAFEKAGIVILEPVMNVEVECLAASVGFVIGDIHRRRGQIKNQRMNGDNAVVHSEAPLSNMFGYQSSLQKLTAGKGMFTMTYSHYAEVPRGHGPDDPDAFPPAVGMRA